MAEQAEDDGEKRIVRPEHDGGTDYDRAGEGRPYDPLAFPATANIERARRRIGADPGDMNEALDSGPERGGGNAPCAVHMYGAKGLLATFQIEADCIHHGEGLGEGIAHPLLVVNIGFDRNQAGISDFEEFPAPLHVP